MRGLLKRIARRILRDELDQLHDARFIASEARRQAMQQLDAAQGELRRARATADSYSKELSERMDRTSRAYEWAKKHALPGGHLRALAEWTHAGTRGTGFEVVHPFDRWGISPKP